MTDVVYGREVVGLFKVDSVWLNIFCATGCSFSFNNELIAKTDVNSGIARKYRVRLSDSKMSFQGVTKTGQADDVLSPFYFLQEGVRRTEGEYQILFTGQDGSEQRIFITGLVESLNISGDISAFSTSDLTIQATGAVTITPAEPPNTMCDEFFSDWWNTTPGSNIVTGLSQSGLSFTGKQVIEVDREGTQYDIVEGTPGNRQVSYDGGNKLTFQSANPFNADETVFVIWADNAS